VYPCLVSILLLVSCFSISSDFLKPTACPFCEMSSSFWVVLVRPRVWQCVSRGLGCTYVRSLEAISTSLSSPHTCSPS
jgi:hypothetical protein